MNLAFKKPDGSWWWVIRRDAITNCIILTKCKAVALWPEDLAYFQKMFPKGEFKLREVLDDTRKV